MSGVTIDANGKLTVSKDAPSGTVTITATVGDLSKTKKVTVTAHAHSWTYSASGSKITAVCGNNGCLNNNQELAISAPTLNVYAGAGNKEATLSATSIGGVATLPAIQYEEQNGADWNVLTDAPVVPGSYRASITVDSNKTAYVEYTIDQATLTVDGTGIASGPYGANLSELTVSGLTAMLNGTEVPGTWTLSGDTVPTVDDSSSYTATFKPVANAEYYKLLTAQVRLSITPAQNAAPAAVVGSYAPNAAETAFEYTISEPVGTGYEYSKDGSNWQDSPVFNDFNAGDKATFYARVKADTNHTASASAHTVEVTFEKLTQDAPDLNYQVSGNSGNRTITITAVSGAEYSFDGGWTWGSSNVKNGIHDETVSVAIRMAETAVYKASEKISASVNTAKPVQTVTFDTTDRTATYGDGTLEARAASAQGAITYESSNITVATVDNMGVVNIVGAGTATITANAAETENHAAAQASYELTVSPKSLTAGDITLTLTESLYHYDGTDKTPEILLKDGNTDLMVGQDYQVKNGSTITASTIGLYTITLTGNGNYTDEISQKWEIIPIAAQLPEIEDQPASASYLQRAKNAMLKVKAKITDGGKLTYQWYSNTENSSVGGTPIVGADGANYKPSTDAVGTMYYYCVVTNTNHKAAGEKVAKVISEVATVTVLSNTVVYEADITVKGQLNTEYSNMRAKLMPLGSTAPLHDTKLLPVEGSTSPQLYRYHNTFADGQYNLVVTAETGGKEVTVTTLIDLRGQNDVHDVSLPGVGKSSIVDDNSDMGIIVGNVEEVAAGQTLQNSNERLEVTLTTEQGYDPQMGLEDAPKIALKAFEDHKKIEVELDIDLTLHLFDANGSKTSINLGNQNTKRLEILIPINTEGRVPEGFAVYRVHNGQLQKLPYGEGDEYFTVDIGGKYIKLCVKRFSSYAIGYGDPIPQNLPQTGDEAQIGMWLALMGLSFAGCIMILAQRKRREN